MRINQNSSRGRISLALLSSLSRPTLLENGGGTSAGILPDEIHHLHVRRFVPSADPGDQPLLDLTPFDVGADGALTSFGPSQSPSHILSFSLRLSVLSTVLPLRRKSCVAIDRAVRTVLHRTRLDFRQLRLSEAWFPRRTLLGNWENKGYLT